MVPEGSLLLIHIFMDHRSRRALMQISQSRAWAMMVRVSSGGKSSPTGASKTKPHGI
jgi:hypothetical protein